MIGTLLEPIDGCLYFELPHREVKMDIATVGGFVSFAISSTNQDDVYRMYQDNMKSAHEYIKDHCEDTANAFLHVVQEPNLTEFQQNGKPSIWEIQCTFRIEEA